MRSQQCPIQNGGQNMKANLSKWTLPYSLLVLECQQNLTKDFSFGTNFEKYSMKKAVQGCLFFHNASIIGGFETSSLPVNKLNVTSHIDRCRFYSKAIGNTRKFGNVNTPVFKPKKVVILSRITRYEFEKIRYKDVTEEQFKSKVSFEKYLKCQI